MTSFLQGLQTLPWSKHMKASRSFFLVGCMWSCCLALSYGQQAGGCQAQSLVNIGRQVAHYELSLQRTSGLTSHQIQSLVQGFQEGLLASCHASITPAVPAKVSPKAPAKPVAGSKPAAPLKAGTPAMHAQRNGGSATLSHAVAAAHGTTNLSAHANPRSQAARKVSLLQVHGATASKGGAPKAVVHSTFAIERLTKPVISGTVDAGASYITGKAEKSARIYLCVWPILPSGPANCYAHPKGSVLPSVLENSENNTMGTFGYVTVGNDGTFRVQPVTPFKQGEFVSVVEVLPSPPGGSPSGKEAPLVSSGSPVQVGSALTSGKASSLYTLGLAGFNTMVTSASKPEAQYFASFDTLAPLPFLGGNFCSTEPGANPNPSGADASDIGKSKATKWKRAHVPPNHPLEQRCWIWTSTRIASAPGPSNTQISSFSTPASLASGVGGQTLSQITQTFDLHAGLGIDFWRGGPWRGTQFGLGRNWARITPSLILSGGFSTPIDSLDNASEFVLSQNLAAQFNQYPSLAKTYPALAKALCDYGYTQSPPCASPSSSTPTYKYVAFLLPNRSRFYSDYSAGIRLRTYFYTGDCKARNDPSCKVDDIFPGIFDIRFGQDQTVTAGMLRGVVMTIDASYPLPGTGGSIRIYGSSYLRLHDNLNEVPLAVTPATSQVAITDPTLVVQPIQPSDQDYYRLGAGVDLVSLISKWFKAASSNAGNK